jgi:L-fucose isomerase-like protein
MKSTRHFADAGCCHRRDFLQTMSAAAGALTFVSSPGFQVAASYAGSAPTKKTPTVHGSFIYPPTASLEREGYWSWPGSSFKPEETQSEYTARIKALANDLQIHVDMESTPLDSNASVQEFAQKVNRSQADAVLLVLFKKFHWDRVMGVLEAVKVPAVVVAPIGVLLAEYVLELRGKPQTYLINSADVFQPLAEALRAISASRRTRDSLIVNIGGEETEEVAEKHLGTHVRTIPHERYYEAFRQVPLDDRVRELAQAYGQGAKEIVEPTEHDITEAARSYFALKQIVDEEKGDALMMDCLPGLRKPHRHVPPCMGFMSLHDEGIVAGCQSDLEATLTMLIVRNLSEKPSFQNNPCLDTERNHFFGAHCTAPSKMAGFDAPPESYLLRSHNEAGWGCVPQVLFREGQEVTMVHYFSEEVPKMSIYTGEVACCYPKLPGGCRTNIEITLNELSDVRDLVYGGHQIIFYGHHSKQLQMFCQLSGIEAVA